MAEPAQVEISITTTSSQIPNWQNLPAPDPPVITLNGTLLPDPSDSPPWQPVGTQVVVIDATKDYTDPASIISNVYQCVANMQGNWGESYRWMWDNVATQIMSSGDVQQQLVLIATFGLDVMMTPTAAPFELFLANGAGGQLQQWGLLPSPSEGGEYIEFPASYCMIGMSGYEYGEATEEFAFSEQGQPVKSSITATLDNAPQPPS